MKKFITALFSLAFIPLAFALEVNTAELRSSASSSQIEFISYEGPHAVINTASQITGIGSEIGEQVARNPLQSGRLGNGSRYSVIHAVDASVKERLDADILIIGASSQLDHINNLRRIISGYLAAAYGYSAKDADTIAVFITVYNAVYRAKIDSFREKYKQIVTDSLDPAICGLSTDYHDWAGKTQIVIPLYDLADGGLSTIDTSVISDKNVISSMKEDDDRSIESRKNLVDLKERESEKAADQAKRTQRQAAEDSKRLDEERKATEQAVKDAEEKERTAEENPDDKEAQEAAEEARARAEDQQAAEKELSQRVEDEREEAARQQALADRKDSEAQKERKEIASDQIAVQKAQAENDAAGSDYALVLVDEKKPLYKIVRYNKENGNAIKESPVNVIRSRQLIKSGDSFVTIAGEEKGNGAVKLILLDSEKMEIIGESEERVAENSMIAQDGNDLYCVIAEKSSFFLGKFSPDLRLEGKSAEAVKSGTPISIGTSSVAVTGSDGKIKVLSKADISSTLGE